MTAPVCPVHHSEMKPGRAGGFYCPRKVGDAWCDQRVSAPKAPGSSTVAPQASPKHLLVLGAWDAASRVFEGTSDASGFLDLANQLLADRSSQS